jgi:LmbE family N-acetylglucosaminyl deacetylase
MPTTNPVPVQEPAGQPATALPAWSSVLAVVAHPDDESFGLGAVLDAFGRAGATTSVLCLTRGEASTVHGVTGDLTTLRAAELREAAGALGVTNAILRDHADGSLSQVAEALAGDVAGVASELKVQGLVVFDPSGVTGHPDHAAATAAALRAAETLNLPVLGWTMPVDVAQRLNTELDATFVGHDPAAIDIVLPVDRDRQRIASLAHASQAVPSSVLWRRLELLGNAEHLRWLRRPRAATVAQAGDEPAPMATMRVDYRSGDQFAVTVRDHVITVDQPEDVGGEDLGPTPTELFVAGLVSCVAFYARRYLRRHKIDAQGLSVEAAYRMGAKPARVSDIEIRIHAPAGLPPERRDGLLAVASHCTVHNSLTTPPDVTIAFA